MQMPVVVGIIVSIIFLVAFSEWFYHLIQGWNEFVLDDVYFGYRIAGISFLSILVMSATFYAMALINECPNEKREGLFEGLNCEQYAKIKTGTENLLFKIENSR